MCLLAMRSLIHCVLELVMKQKYAFPKVFLLFVGIISKLVLSSLNLISVFQIKIKKNLKIKICIEL